MRVEYHPAVARDVAEAMKYYDSVSHRLAAEFQNEFRRLVSVAASKPTQFRAVNPGLHRVNLRRFPYHFLYRELADGIRFTLLRHHRRHPDFGTERR